MAFTTGHNANYLRRAVQTHKQKVKSLYKRVLRNEESWVKPDLKEWLIARVHVRQRFEENRHIKDLRKAKILLMEGEEELYQCLHPRPMKFFYSPGGICFERYFEYADWHVDQWTPHEKAIYPYYCAKREERKKEFCKMWEQRYKMPAEKFFGVTEYQDYHEEPPTEEQKKYGPFKIVQSRTVQEWEAQHGKKIEDKSHSSPDGQLS